MKRLRFTLPAVRTLRQREEQTALERYARALLQKQVATDQLAVAENELTRAQAEQRRLLEGHAPAAKLSTTHAFARSTEDRRNGCVAALQVAERVLQQTLQAMLAARRAREAVERFRGQRKQAYAAQRDEQKLLDDLAARPPRPDLIPAAAGRKRH